MAILEPQDQPDLKVTLAPLVSLFHPKSPDLLVLLVILARMELPASLVALAQLDLLDPSDLKVYPAKLEPLVSLDTPVLKERLESLATLALLVKMVFMAHPAKYPVPSDLKDPKDLPAILVHPERMVSPALLVLLAKMDSPDHQDTLVHKLKQLFCFLTRKP